MLPVFSGWGPLPGEVPGLAVSFRLPSFVGLLGALLLLIPSGLIYAQWFQRKAPVRRRVFRAGEITQQWRALAALQRTRVQFLALTSWGSQLPVTIASGCVTSFSVLLGTHTHVGRHIGRSLNCNKSLKRIFKENWFYCHQQISTGSSFSARGEGLAPPPLLECSLPGSWTSSNSWWVPECCCPVRSARCHFAPVLPSLWLPRCFHCIQIWSLSLGQREWIHMSLLWCSNLWSLILCQVWATVHWTKKLISWRRRAALIHDTEKQI